MKRVACPRNQLYLQQQILMHPAPRPGTAALTERQDRRQIAANGRSAKAIAQTLNREAIVGPHGGAWGPSTIAGNAARGSGILNNELYVGRLVWNRLRYIKDPRTGRRVSRLNDPQQLVVVEAPELRIIDDELITSAARPHATRARAPTS